MIFKTRSIQLRLPRPTTELSDECCPACLHVRAIFSIVNEIVEPMGITDVYCIHASDTDCL
jgi:hypothetical protein